MDMGGGEILCQDWRIAQPIALPSFLSSLLPIRMRRFGPLLCHKTSAE